MTNGFLLSRILLQFESDSEDLLNELSAVARTPDGNIWVGSDEFITLERLTPMGDNIYGNHKTFHLKDYINLSDDDSEIDIEGLAYSDGYLWVIGSHSLKRKKPKGKKPIKDIERLSTIKSDSNRYLLARFPLLNGEIVPTCALPETEESLTAACLAKVNDRSPLINALLDDEHLSMFLTNGLPSKDNGFDIEGLAVRGNKVMIGLRGPVLRGWAIVIELELQENITGILELKELEEGVLYRKHFLNLNGLGVRELCWHDDDLIVLAGPTMELEGAMQLFRFEDVLDHSNDTIWDQESGSLKLVCTLPFTLGNDHAEGLTLIPCCGYDDGLMIVYDSPNPNRFFDKQSIFADVFRLPQSR